MENMQLEKKAKEILKTEAQKNENSQNAHC